MRDVGNIYLPSPTLADWLRATFVDGDGELINPDHLHLKSARIGCLWTNVPQVKQGRNVLANARMPRFEGDTWQRGWQEQQIEGWFGAVPDFIITFFAPFMEAADDATFCAVSEHELYHCGQKRDDFGAPKFNRETGLPIFAVRGHDVEEFVGVVERYGMAAAGDDVRRIVAAANRTPLLAARDISRACGTCLAKAS